MSAFLCKKKETKKLLFMLHLYLQGFLLPLSFLFLSVFPQAPFACLHLVFQKKLLSSLLSGAHLLPLLSITQPAVRRHRWLRAAPLCLWSLMWPAADVHSPRGEGKHEANPRIHSGGVESENSLSLQALSKRLTIHHEVTLSGLYEMAHRGTEPRAELGNSPLGNETPPLGDLLWAANTSCSRLTLRAAWCHSTSFSLWRNDKWWSVMWGRFVDSWHTNLQSLKEMDDTWWSTVHLLLHKPLALTGRAMWNV